MLAAPLRRHRPRCTPAALALLAAALVVHAAAAIPPAERAALPLAQLDAAPRPADAIEEPPLDELADLPTVLDRIERLIERGEWQAAEALLEPVLADQNTARRHEPWYWLALAKAGQLEFNAARSAARQAVRRAYGDADSHFLLGGLWEQKRAFTNARQHYLTAARAAQTEVTNVTPTLAWLELGKLLERRGYTLAAAEAFARFDRAVFVTHQEQRNEPRVAALLRAHPLGMVPDRVRLLRSVGRYDDAVTATAEALRRVPDDPTVARLHALALADAGRAAEAWDFLAPLLADQPADALIPAAVTVADAAGALTDWLATLATDLARDADPHVAWIAFRAAAERFPDRALPLGAALQDRLPRTQELAEAVLGAALRAGDWDAAHDALVQHYESQRGLRTLPLAHLRLLDRLLREYPAFAQLLASRTRTTAAPAAAPSDGAALAYALARALQDRDQAAAVTAQLAERPAFAAFARSLPALLALEAYDWDAALAQADAQLTAGSDAVWPYYIKGRALLGRDETEAAEAALREAIGRDPDAWHYALALADAYRRNGNLRSAPRFYRAVLAEVPGHPDALEGLFETYLQDNKLEVARLLVDNLNDRPVPPPTLRLLRTALAHLEQLFGRAHLAELQHFTEIYPPDARTLKLLSGGLFSRGEFRSAVDFARRGRALAPEDYHLNYVLARALAADGRFAEASDVFEQLARWYPRRVPVLSGYARALLFDFQIDPGRAVLRDLLELDLTDEQRAEIRATLQTSFAAFGEFDRALELVRTWRADDPSDLALLASELTLLDSLDRRDDAQALLQEWYAEAPAQRWSEFVVLGARVDLAAEAARAFQEQVGVEQMTVEQADQLITLLLASEQFEAARKVADAFEGSFREATLRRVWLGRIAAAEDQLDLALREFDALIESQFIDTQMRVAIAREVAGAFIDAQEYAQGAEWLASFLDRFGGGAGPEVREEIMRIRRSLLAAAGNEAEGLALAEQLLELRPTDPGLLNDVGYTWADRGEHLDEALRMIREAVAANPWNAAFLDSLGWVHYKRGELEPAVEYLARAAALYEGRDSTIFDQFGDALWRAGEKDRAIRTWRTGLEILAEEQQADIIAPDLEQRRANLRAKLAAAAAGETPPLAPLGNMQEEQE